MGSRLNPQKRILFRIIWVVGDIESWDVGIIFNLAIASQA